jgi:hypothetical protein
MRLLLLLLNKKVTLVVCLFWGAIISLKDLGFVGVGVEGGHFSILLHEQLNHTVNLDGNTHVYVKREK